MMDLVAAISGRVGVPPAAFGILPNASVRRFSVVRFAARRREWRARCPPYPRSAQPLQPRTDSGLSDGERFNDQTIHEMEGGPPATPLKLQTCELNNLSF